MWTVPPSYSLSGWAGFGVAPVFETTLTTKKIWQRSPVVTERRTAILTENSNDGFNSKTPSFSQRAPCGSKTGPCCGSLREPPSVRTEGLPAAPTELPRGSDREPSRFLHKVVTVLTESPRVSYREPPRDCTFARPDCHLLFRGARSALSESCGWKVVRHVFEH